MPSFYGGGGYSANRDCVQDVKALLKEAVAGKADGVVLDLAENGGGLLRAAVDLSGLFLASGPMVAIQGRHQSARRLSDTDPSLNYAGPLAVLVSKASASASEIVAGALKDYRRAIIIGDDHTFGKGTVQNIEDLPPGLGALKVTTSLFYRPQGKSTQNEGVSSDIIVQSEFNRGDHGEKHQPYALSPHSIPGYVTQTVHPKTGADWVEIKAEELKRLQERSASRVAKNEALMKVQKELKKYSENQGAVTLKELMEKDKGDKDVDGDTEDEDKPSPRRLEAVEILADLISHRNALEKK